jgi:hypothetical protein
MVSFRVLMFKAGLLLFADFTKASITLGARYNASSILLLGYSKSIDVAASRQVKKPAILLDPKTLWNRQVPTRTS